MTSAQDVEKKIREDKFYGDLVIPVCFPAYFVGGESGLREQYMQEGSPDMDEKTFANMVAQCSQVMTVYAILLKRSSS